MTSPGQAGRGGGPRTPVPRRRRIWRGAARAVALATAAITIMVVSLAVAMRRNDAAIEGNLGSATATVLTVSPLRTGIEFVDHEGVSVRPANGVLYPGLLSVGQQFVVEYSTVEPGIVRVAGRSAAVGNLMLVLTLGLTYVIAVPLTRLCLRRARLPLVGLRRVPGHAAGPSRETSGRARSAG